MRLGAVRFSPGAHLEMARPYTVFYPALSAIAGLQLATSGSASNARAALTGGVTMLGWIAGLYAGDYYDRDLDAQAKPGRAIPSGRVSPREAFATMVGLIAIGYVGAALLSWANLGVAVLATALALLYSKTFKARGLVGNFDRGLLGACAVLFGALAGGHAGRPDVWVLALLLFFQDSASNLVGTLRDVEGDRQSSYRTLPVSHGVHVGTQVACGLAVLATTTCSVLAIMLQPGYAAAILFTASIALVVLVFARLWSARRTLDRRRALTAHKYLVVQRMVLIGAVIAVHVPAGVVALLLGATVLLTLVSQRALRDRYELEALPGR